MVHVFCMRKWIIFANIIVKHYLSWLGSIHLDVDRNERLLLIKETIPEVHTKQKVVPLQKAIGQTISPPWLQLRTFNLRNV